MDARSSAGVGLTHLAVAKLLRAPLWLLVSAALGRLLGPEGLGTLSLVLAAGMFLNQLLLHWTHSITQRFGRGEWLETQTFRRTFATRWPLVLAGLAIALAVLTLLPGAAVSGLFGLSEQETWLIALAMLAFWVMGEAQSLQQVRERFATMAWAPVISDSLLLIVVLLLATAGALAVSVAYGMIVGCMLMAAAWWLCWEVRSVRVELTTPSRKEMSRAVVFAAPLVPAALIGYASEWCDYFLIRHLLSEREVGLFHPAFQYALIMVGLPSALAAVILPRLVGETKGGDALPVRTLVHDQLPKWIVIWGGVSLPVCAVLPALFSVLLGREYASSVLLLEVMLLAVPGAIVQHVCGAACFVQGRLGMATVGLFGMKVVINVSVSYVLLSWIGVIGSAIGVAISYLILQWLFLIDQRLRIHQSCRNGFVLLLAVQGGAASLLLVPGLIPRLAVALVVLAMLILMCRSMRVLSVAEVSEVLPPRVASWATPVAQLLFGPDRKVGDGD